MTRSLPFPPCADRATRPCAGKMGYPTAITVSRGWSPLPRASILNGEMRWDGLVRAGERDQAIGYMRETRSVSQGSRTEGPVRCCRGVGVGAASRNPMAWMIQVNGFLVDARFLKREYQEEALRQGLIPYIPDRPQPFRDEDDEE